MNLLNVKYLGILFFTVLVLAGCKEAKNSNEASMMGSLRGDSTSTRFEAEIQKFEVADKQKFPPKNAILFTGSSSIRMWETLERDMAPLPAINRGFGGSTIPEVIQYADRIVFLYAPQIIVLYCGENDIHEKALPQEVVQNFKIFVGMVKEKLPDTQVVFLSMKPSLSRWDEWRSFRVGNGMIEKFAASQDNIHYLNVGRMMLKNEQPDSNIFIEDGLHMNEHGYARWTSLVKPFLKDLYQREN